MAESPEAGEKPLEELEKEITCAVCQTTYQQAKLLPCNHYYCSPCIEKLAARSRGKPFDCPECRKETILPPGGVVELQPAFFVERMKDVYVKIAKIEGKVEAVCEQCSVDKSVAFCRQCTEFICSDCVLSHKKLKVFAGHAVASLEDLKKGGVKSIPVKEALSRCSEHEKTLKLFCFDCDRLICRDCTIIIDHREHRFEFLKKCASDSRKTLRDSLAPLLEVKANMELAEKKLVSEEGKVDRQRDRVWSSIQQSFDRLKAVLDQRKSELVKKAGSLAQEKKNVLAAQKKVLQMAQKEVQLLVELVERNVESTNDQDIMKIHTQLQNKMEEEEKHHRQTSLIPTATADIACHLPSPNIIPDHLGSVFDGAAREVCVSPPNTCEVGSPVKVVIASPTASLDDVSAELKCVLDPSLLQEGEVVRENGGVFSISVTPEVRGRHDLVVKVKDEQILGSPFGVFVKFPPSKLVQGKPSMVGGLQAPWGIAINDKQQLVVSVAERGGEKIVVMERDGKEIQTIECNQFKNPCGVATTSDGSIYVTDVVAKCLLKFNSEGELVKAIYNKLEEPYGIKLIENQLYVADCQSHQVKIFDRDCRVVGTIKTKECPKPQAVAVGPEGLYVAGKGRISVYTCVPKGSFIRHLNLTPRSLKLSEFNGLSFDSSGHVIACDWKHGVYFFKPSGECVGHVSSDVIQSPADVTVDEDGFVYVCSFCHDHGVMLL